MDAGDKIKQKRFLCSFCNYSCDRRNDMVRHERTHTGEKPFKCKYCNESFAQKPHLVTHLRIHTGEKPFNCKLCDKSFAQKSVLVSHERLHTGEKPFECKQCDMSFVQKSALVSHERVHFGKKPYSCSHCNKSYTTSSGLNQHKKKCSGFVIEEETSTESDNLSEFIYNPDNEAHHNVISTTRNHEMLGQPENICEETVHILVESNQDVKEEIIDSGMCQKVDEVQESAALHTEIDIKEEDIYDEESVDIQTTEFNSMKLKRENESNGESIDEDPLKVTDIKEECFDF